MSDTSSHPTIKQAAEARLSELAAAVEALIFATGPEDGTDETG